MKSLSFLTQARVIFVGSLLTIVCWATQAQQMVHRYSFDQDAADLVGDAHGELVGDATITDGAVVLSGTKPSYVNLPNDLVANLTNATFVIWTSWAGGPVWTRIWDF